MFTLAISYLTTSCKELTHWKRLWCWEGLEAGEGDDRGWDGWMASPARCMWIWVNSGSWWWTGRPGVLRFMGSQRVGHDWAISLHYLSFRLGKIIESGQHGTDTVRKLSVQFSSVPQLCPTLLCDPMNRSTPGLLVHHQLLEFTQKHVHRAGDAIQPSHPLPFPYPPVPNPSQHQRLFQWVNSSHEVAKVLEFQPQHQFFQWKPRADLL